MNIETERRGSILCTKRQQILPIPAKIMSQNMQISMRITGLRKQGNQNW